MMCLKSGNRECFGVRHWEAPYPYCSLRYQGPVLAVLSLLEFEE